VSSNRLPILLAIGVGVLAGLGAFTFRYAEGFSYFSNDPRACANCHAMNDHYASWQASPHHGVAACNDCHTPHEPLPKLWTKAQNGWNHSSRFTLQNYPENIRITPANARRLEHNCLGCHREMVGEIFPSHGIGETGDLHCVHCHAGVGHGPRR
jgi:cytochrome c nitrite reductase small subunit